MSRKKKWYSIIVRIDYKDCAQLILDTKNKDLITKALLKNVPDMECYEILDIKYFGDSPYVRSYVEKHKEYSEVTYA